MVIISQLLHLVRTLTADRNRLVLENAALRHQVALLKRTVKRPHIKDSDRISWIMMRRFLKDWQDALLFVKPETVIHWHRKGWKYHWKRKSKPKKQGRPPVSFKLIHLIRRLQRDRQPERRRPHRLAQYLVR